MVRRAILVVVLAGGCGGGATTGPAWPKSAGTEVDPDLAAEDGGESIEPRHDSAVAAIEASTEPTPEPDPAAVKPVDPAAPVPEVPGTTTPTTPTPPTLEEPAIEEIVIEIND